MLLETSLAGGLRRGTVQGEKRLGFGAGIHFQIEFLGKAGFFYYKGRVLLRIYKDFSILGG